MQEIGSILSLIGAVQGFFIGTFLFTKKENPIPNRLLSILIITISIGMAAKHAGMNEINLNKIHLMGLLISLPSTYGPLIYLYVNSILSKNKVFNLKELIHFIPTGVIFITFTIIRYTFLDNRLPYKIPEMKIIMIISITISAALGLIYSTIAYLNIKKYDTKIEDFFSHVDKIDLLWLKRIIFIFIFISISWNSAIWINVFYGSHENPVIIPIAILHISMVTMIFTISYYALKQPEIFDKTYLMESELKEENKTIETDPQKKYARHSIDKKTRKKYYIELENYMASEKPYLYEDLTLKDLANNLDIPSHHLSIVINSETDSNFYTFINSYRVNEVKKTLSNPENEESNILSIAYDAGFNSKTTFNTMFKKITGQTPTEFKKNII